MVDDYSISLTDIFSSEIYSGIEGLEKSQQDTLSNLMDSLIDHLPGFDKAISKKLEQPSNELESCFIELQPETTLQSQTRSKEQESLCFALSSCQYPAGILDQEPAFQSYKRLNKLLIEKDKKPSVFLLVGDQVYVDATAGLFDPTTINGLYHQPYQKLYQNKYVHEVMRKLPTVNMLDDHEIDNNWEPIPCDDDNQKKWN